MNNANSERGVATDITMRTSSKVISSAVNPPSTSDVPLSFSSAFIDANWESLRDEPLSSHLTMRAAAIRSLATSSENVGSVALAEMAQHLRNPAIPAAVGAMIQPTPTKTVEPGVPMYSAHDFASRCSQIIEKCLPKNSSLRDPVISLLVSFYLEAAMEAGYVIKGEKTSVLRTSRTLIPNYKQFTNLLIGQLLTNVMGKRKFRLDGSRKVGPNVIFDPIREECQMLASDLESISMQLTAWHNLAALATLSVVGSYRTKATAEQLSAFQSVPVQEFTRNLTLMRAALLHFGSVSNAAMAAPISTTFASVMGNMAGLVSTLGSCPDLKSVPASFFNSSMSWYSVETPSSALIQVIGTMRFAVKPMACVSVYIPNSAPRTDLHAFTKVSTLTSIAQQVQDMISPLTDLNIGPMLATLHASAIDLGQAKAFSLAAFGVSPAGQPGLPCVTLSRLPRCLNTDADGFRELIAMGVPGVRVSVQADESSTQPLFLYSFVPVRTDITTVRGNHVGGLLYTRDPNVVLAFNTLANGVVEQKGSSSIEVPVPIVTEAMIDGFIVSPRDGNIMDIMVGGDPKNQLNRSDIFKIRLPDGTVQSTEVSLHYLLTNDATSDERVDRRMVFAHYNMLMADMTQAGLLVLHEIFSAKTNSIPASQRAAIVAAKLLPVISSPLLAGLAASLRLHMLRNPSLTKDARISLYDYGFNRVAEVSLRLMLLRAVLIRFGYLPHSTQMFSFEEAGATEVIQQLALQL